MSKWIESIKQELADKASDVDQAVQSYRRADRMLDQLQEELERIQEEIRVGGQENADRLAWLEENMKPDDFSSEFGYYPKDRRGSC